MCREGAATWTMDKSAEELECARLRSVMRSHLFAQELKDAERETAPGRASVSAQCPPVVSEGPAWALTHCGVEGPTKFGNEDVVGYYGHNERGTKEKVGF